METPTETIDSTEEDCLLVVAQGAMSGGEITTLRMPPLSDGRRVKAALTAHLQNTEFVQALVTEDGKVMEDKMTFADFGICSTVRLSVVFGKFKWDGIWVPVRVSDYRIGDYMEEKANLCIEADGSIGLFSRHKDLLFKGEPPHANENFTVRSLGHTDALEKMAMVRQQDGSIRVTHGGSCYSWLREESAFIDYRLLAPSEAPPTHASLYSTFISRRIIDNAFSVSESASGSLVKPQYTLAPAFRCSDVGWVNLQSLLDSICDLVEKALGSEGLSELEVADLRTLENCRNLPSFSRFCANRELLRKFIEVHLMPLNDGRRRCVHLSKNDWPNFTGLQVSLDQKNSVTYTSEDGVTYVAY